MENRVEIMEVGLRDGLQNVNKNLSIEDRLFIINGLISAGIKNIQVTSFVNPKIVPQMAQAEDLVNQIPKIKNIEFSALAFNQKGMILGVYESIGSLARIIGPIMVYFLMYDFIESLYLILGFLTLSQLILFYLLKKKQLKYHL